MKAHYTASWTLVLTCLFSAGALSQASPSRPSAGSPPSGEALSESEQLYRRGVEALQGNDLETARDALERAVAADPRAARAHRLLGQVLALQGRLEAALASLGDCLELTPEDAQARILKSIVLAGLDRLERGAAP